MKYECCNRPGINSFFFLKKSQFVLKNLVYECPSISKGLPTFRLILHLQQTFLVVFFVGMSYLSMQNVKRSRFLNIALLDTFFHLII